VASYFGLIPREYSRGGRGHNCLCNAEPDVLCKLAGCKWRSDADHHYFLSSFSGYCISLRLSCYIGGYGSILNHTDLLKEILQQSLLSRLRPAEAMKHDQNLDVPDSLEERWELS
jgi:hypothetical protein